MQKRPIRVFHAVDSANLRGEFKGWTRAARDEYVAKLLPVIGDAPLVGHVVGFDNRDFEAVAEANPRARDALGTPYGFCLHVSLEIILRDLNRLGIRDRINIVHESNDYRGDAAASFDWIRSRPEHEGRDLRFSFADKAGAAPLQAADILAYEGNKRLRNLEAPERRAWRALNPDRNKVGLHVYNRAAIENWLAALQIAGAGRP